MAKFGRAIEGHLRRTAQDKALLAQSLQDASLKTPQVFRTVVGDRRLDTAGGTPQVGHRRLDTVASTVDDASLKTPQVFRKVVGNRRLDTS